MADSLTPRIGIIGCGLVGRKRSVALAGGTLTVCADVLPDRAASLAASTGARLESVDVAIAAPDVDVIVIATTNDALAELSVRALREGKHVLVEKPAGRTTAEIDAIADAARASGRRVRVGFNHRYHPALQHARRIVDAGELGPLMFVRGRYGHGGRLGYEKEWRADPSKSGGGELIDQGVHLIDLARWFLGSFSEIEGHAGTYFWNMPVDDNAFLLLRTTTGATAFLHASCTEWKNLFSMEIYGTLGKLVIDGLGGSYGVERLTYYKMRPEMGPPDMTIDEYPGTDSSWASEFERFLDDIRMNREPDAGISDARAALEVVEKIYGRSGYVLPATSPASFTA